MADAGDGGNGGGRMTERSFNTMSEAIALSSPSGRMSKAARKRAEERLRHTLFDGITFHTVTQPSDKEYYMRKAQEFYALASRGVKPIAYRKEAQRLERLAQSLESKQEG
jgi:hypothetical protein